MEKFSLEGAEALDLGPLPLVEDSGAVDEDVCHVILDTAVGFDLDVPLAHGVVPDGGNDLGLELHALVEAILLGGSLNVVPDLGARGVEGRPIGVRFERKGVNVRRDLKMLS